MARKTWLHSEQRALIRREIDNLTGEKTEYRIYEALVGGIIPKYASTK
jgi:hypothetical protein